MENDWDLIHKNSYLSDNEEEEVPLLDIENRERKSKSEETSLVDIEKGEGTLVSDDKQVQPFFRQRSKKRPRSKVTLNRSDRINYVITGSGFLEPAGSKRLKLDEQQFVRINVSPGHDTRGLKKPGNMFGRYNAMCVIAICIIIALTLIVLTGFMLSREDVAYHSYLDLSQKNETLSFNKWFHCRYWIRENVKTLPEYCNSLLN